MTSRNKGKWFISKKGNRCRYIYNTKGKKVGIEWRSTKKTMIHGRMQKNKGYINLNIKLPKDGGYHGRAMANLYEANMKKQYKGYY